MSNGRLYEQCLSFVRRVLAEASPVLTKGSVEQAESLIAALNTAIRSSTLDEDKNSPHTPKQDVVVNQTDRRLLELALGEEARALLIAVGTEGYGRLGDIRRHMEPISKRNLFTEEGWKRLFSFGLLYGQNYAFLTSRGVRIFMVLTGKEPRPSKKGERLFPPAPLRESVDAVTDRLKDTLPLPGSEIFLLRVIYTNKVYNLRSLKAEKSVKHFFYSNDEIASTLSSLRERGLVVLRGDKGIVLTPLGRELSICLWGQRNSRTRFGTEPGRQTTWMDEVIQHFQKAGYRILRKDQAVEVFDKGRKTVSYDMVIVSGKRREGILFPPFEDKRSVEEFRQKIDTILRHSHSLKVIGPSTVAIERAKKVFFNWLAKHGRTKHFQAVFCTKQQVLTDNPEIIAIEPSA